MIIKGEKVSPSDARKPVIGQSDMCCPYFEVAGKDEEGRPILNCSNPNTLIYNKNYIAGACIFESATKGCVFCGFAREVSNEGFTS